MRRCGRQSPTTARVPTTTCCKALACERHDLGPVTLPGGGAYVVQGRNLRQCPVLNVGAFSMHCS